MSVTRLLILGAVRIFQPTHGYFVRRELGTWQVADWAHLNPGSIYNALRVLTKDGMLVEEPQTEQTSRTGTKTTYRLTVDGESEFQRLVREALWELHPYDPSWLLAGMSFWGTLPRAEVLAALEARASLLNARISGSRFAVAGMDQTAAGTPAHIVEHFYLQEQQLQAELRWIGDVSEKIKGGAYGFAGEDPHRLMPRENPLRPPGEQPK
jgi:DNA-binding PadR family transcriptional regulator